MKLIKYKSNDVTLILRIDRNVMILSFLTLKKNFPKDARIHKDIVP